MDLAQAKRNYLLKQLSLNATSYDYSTEDMSKTFYGENELVWLQANGATSDNMYDAWRQYLDSEGYTQANLEDAKLQFYNDNS
jgi:hypothetical protein